MFEKFEFDFEKKIIDIEEDYIDLQNEEKGDISIINPNHKSIIIQFFCNDIISIEKEVEILPKCKTKIPFFVVDKNNSFKEKIFIHNQDEVYSVVVSFKKRENENSLLIGDYKVNNLFQLYNLYLKEYDLFVEKFFSLDFKNWLKALDSNIYSLYILFLEDTKEERVLENFFVSTKIKDKSYIYFLQEEIKVVEDESIKVIDIELGITDGFCEEDILIYGDMDFLTLEKTKVGSYDFENNKASIKGIIDFNKIPLSKTFVYVSIGKEKLKINLVKKREVDFIFEKTLLRDGDNSTLNICNNSQKDITFKLKNSLSYIKIPDEIIVRRGQTFTFDMFIVFTTMQKAFLKINKTPYLEGEITCEYKVLSKIKTKSFKYKILVQKVGK